jgi:hypothetical protein
MYPAHRIHTRLIQTAVAGAVNPFAGGADQALVLHLSNGSQDPAFRADVAAKEGNQDRALGLLLMAVRFGLLLWVGTEWTRAWVRPHHTATNLPCRPSSAQFWSVLKRFISLSGLARLLI